MEQSDNYLFKLTSLLFDAALGSSYYPEFSSYTGQHGIDTLAEGWGNSEITNTMLGATPEAQARNLALNLGLNPDDTNPESGDNIAYNFFLTSLQSGMNVGSLAMAAIRYLEQDDILPQLEETRSYLNNRAELAYQYTVTLGLGSRDVAELQDVIDPVTSDPHSIAEILHPIIVDEFENIRDGSPIEPYPDSDDEITGTDAADYIDAGAGYDEVNAGDGADIILGNSGDDELYGEKGQDIIDGGDGADELFAGTYYEYLREGGYYDDNGDYISSYYVYEIDAHYEVLNGGSGADKIYGGYGSDNISGGEGSDRIYGDHNATYFDQEDVDRETLARMYNDTISGGEGDDYIDAGYGNDQIDGGDGDDTIYAGFGSDTLEGGAGNDKIYLNGNQNRKTTKDGQNTASGGEGNDTIYAVGHDNVDAGAGDDRVYIYRTEESDHHGVIIAGEGADAILVQDYYNNDKSSSRVSIDLQESQQEIDSISIDIPSRLTSLVEILNFDLESDTLDIQKSVDIYGHEGPYGNSTSSALQFNYSGDLTKNYVQIVNSITSPWLTESENKDTPDDYGKAYFVIQGAQANSESVSDVASFLDSYGNNASYEKSDDHIFVVNVNDNDLGIYLFTDDTGANDRIVSDELTPIAVLVGVTTEDLTYDNVDFLI